MALPWDHTDPHAVLADLGRPATGPATDGARWSSAAASARTPSTWPRLGWRTTAFDISPAAVAAVRDRYPDSAVDYREG